MIYIYISFQRAGGGVTVIGGMFFAYTRFDDNIQWPRAFCTIFGFCCVLFGVFAGDLETIPFWFFTIGYNVLNLGLFLAFCFGRPSPFLEVWIWVGTWLFAIGRSVILARAHIENTKE